MNSRNPSLANCNVVEELPVRNSFLPFSRPFIGDEEKNEVLAALDSDWLSMGPRVKRFEAEMCEYLGTKHAIALSSCTAGLHLALVAAGIGPGDEVITSPLTFVSTTNVIVHTGARPVFVDIRPDTYNISLAELERSLTPKTKAVMPVHYAGQPCEMGEIRKLCHDRGLLVIEDAAHAIGAKYRGRLIGGDVDGVAVFSFYPTKNLTTGEGGMLVTDRAELAENVRNLSLHGITRDAWKRYSATGSWYYEVVAPGFKCNMTDIQAALGLVQLKRLEGFLSRRQEICERYNDAFSDLKEIVTPWVSPEVRHARHLYPIRLVLDRLRIGRGEFIEALKAENVGSSVHFIPVHFHPYYRDAYGYRPGSFPVAESTYAGLVSLPLFPQMANEDVASVCAAVRKLVTRYRK